MREDLPRMTRMKQMDADVEHVWQSSALIRVIRFICGKSSACLSLRPPCSPWFILFVLCLPLGTVAQTPAVPVEAVTVTVQAGARQTFGGFGTSLINWQGDYQRLTPDERKTLSGKLWHDLKFRHLRLWCNLDRYAAEPGKRDLSEFRRWYVDSGIIADAKKLGVTTLLLAPDGVPSYMKEKSPQGSSNSHLKLKDGMEDDYARLIADFIAQLQREANIAIDVTGIQNEPNDEDRFLPAQIVRVVKTLRHELDARNLNKISIIAPENASVDGIFYEQLDALHNDGEAWNALRGVASHSYNMAATPDAAKRAFGKEYWMTEASDNGPEEPGDAVRASSLASRVLNDLNHGVTHWIHFVGFENPDPRDNATRILKYTVQPLQITTFQKFYYYAQLARAFDVGSVLRHSLSASEGEMTWTYGKKPHLYAACALNPDDSWSVALSNFTDTTFRADSATGKFDIDQGGGAARLLNVTLHIEELKQSGDVPFMVTRSSRLGESGKPQRIVFHNGEATVPVAPLELVTIRSAPLRKPRN